MLDNEMPARPRIHAGSMARRRGAALIGETQSPLETAAGARPAREAVYGCARHGRGPSIAGGNLIDCIHSCGSPAGAGSSLGRRPPMTSNPSSSIIIARYRQHLKEKPALGARALSAGGMWLGGGGVKAVPAAATARGGGNGAGAQPALVAVARARRLGDQSISARCIIHRALIYSAYRPA